MQGMVPVTVKDKKAATTAICWEQWGGATVLCPANTEATF